VNAKVAGSGSVNKR